MIDVFAAASLPSVAFAVLAVLLDLTLKGALLLALAGLLTALLKNTSASTRHLIWSLALCSVLLLPVLTVTLPAWRLSFLSDIPFLEEAIASLDRSMEPPAEVVADRTPTEAAAAPVRVTGTPAVQEAPTPEGEQGAPATRRLAHDVVLGAFSQMYEAARTTPWPVWLLFIWGAGVVAVLFRFLVGAFGVAWLAYRARPIRDPSWIRLMDDIQDRLGVRRRVRLLRSVRTAMPMTWGIFRPVVLLPYRASDWPEARRRCVLTHELAHVRRWDCLTQTMAQLACALCWFNPLVWVAARRMRHERELACDDYVLCDAIRPSDYAAHLLDIARTTRSTLVIPLGAVNMARPSQLEGRVVSILDATRKRGAQGRLVTASSFVLAIVLVLPLAAMQPAENASALADDPAFERVATEQGEAYQWVGRVDDGKSITIRGLRGHVQATPTDGASVKVMALPRDTSFSSTLRIAEEGETVVICIPDLLDPERCAFDSWHDAAPIAQPRIDFIALIPQGVRFSGSTHDGNVTIVGLHSDVEAVTEEGDIFVQTTGSVSAHAVEGDVKLRTRGYARASTREGDIHATLGRTDWTGPLPFTSVDGDITVELPEGANTEIDLHVEANGRLQSAISMQRRNRGNGERFRGVLGEGGRLLAIHTVDGNITITHRGTQTVQALNTYDVEPRKDRTPRGQRAGSVYRAEARPGPAQEPAKTPSKTYVAARRLPEVRHTRSTQAQPRVREVDLEELDLDMNLRRLRREISRLDDALDEEIFETAAYALNNLDLGVAVSKQDLIKVLQTMEREDTRFARQLKRLGFKEFSREEVFLAQLVGINRSYVESVQKAGYCPSLKELVALKVAGVDWQYLRDMASEGYDELQVKDLVTLRKSGVDREVIHEMEEQGIYEPTVEEMVEYTNEHGPVPQ